MSKQASMIRHTIAAVVGAVAISAGTVAFADIWGDTHVSTTAEGLRTVSVSFADLDLNDAAGRAILDSRVREAAKEVCGSSDYRITGSLRVASENKECAQRAIESARYQTGSSQVAVVSR